MKVVLDTNVLVRANPKTSPPGLARDLLLTVVSGPHTLIVSRYLLNEVKQVLSYPHTKALALVPGSHRQLSSAVALVVESMHPPRCRCFMYAG